MRREGASRCNALGVCQAHQPPCVDCHGAVREAPRTTWAPVAIDGPYRREGVVVVWTRRAMQRTASVLERLMGSPYRG